MKKFLKLLVVSVISLLVSTLFPSIAMAGTMVVNGGGTYGIGDTVAIIIQIYGDDADDGIYAYNGYLDYDTNVLSGSTDFLGDSDGGKYVETVVYLTVTGYGDTSVYVDGGYSDGFGKYGVSGSTYVSVPYPEEPQPLEPVTDSPGDDYGDDDDEPAETEAPQYVEPVTEQASETTTAVDMSKFDVTVDNTSKRIVNSFTATETVDEMNVQIPNPAISNLPVLNGFTLTTTTYNGETVDIFQVPDLIDVYVLSDANGENADYYSYDKANKTFRKLVYGIFNSKTFVVLDIPENVSLNGYEKKELGICNGKVVAFQAATAANENKDSLANASPSDFYVVYAIADGNPGYYSYDKKDETMQRLNSGFVDGLVKETIVSPETEKETQAPVVYAESSGFSGLPRTVKVLLIVLIVIIIALAVLLIIFIPKKNKLEKKKMADKVPKSVRSIYMVEEDYSPMDIDYNGQEPQIAGRKAEETEVKETTDSENTENENSKEENNG